MADNTAATTYGPYMVPNTEGLFWLLAALRSQVACMLALYQPIMGFAMQCPPPSPSVDAYAQFYTGPREDIAFDERAHNKAVHEYTSKLMSLVQNLEALCTALDKRRCFSADDVERLRVGALSSKPPSRQMWVAQVTHDVTNEQLAWAFDQLYGLVDVPFDLPRHAVLPQVFGAFASASAVRFAAFTHEY